MRALLLALALLVGAPTLAHARPPMETNQIVDGDGNPLGTPANPLNVTGAAGGAANPYPGSDYATAPRQDTMIGTFGAKTDAAAATGDGSVIALEKAIRDRLAGTLTVQGTPGGLPQTVVPSDAVTPAGSPFSLMATGSNTGWIDTTGFQSIMVAPNTNGGSGGIYVFETSDDQTTAYSASAFLVSSTGTSITATGGNTTMAYAVPATHRYFRVRLTSAHATNPMLISLRLRAVPVAPGSVFVGGIAAGSNVIGSTTLRSAGTNRSATIGATAVTVMAANAGRQGWKVKNDSTGDIWINFDGTATATPGGGNIKIPANTYLASEPGFVETGAMSVIGSAAGLAITAREH